MWTNSLDQLYSCWMENQNKGNDGKDLKYEESDMDDRGELANLVFLLCNVQGLCMVEVGKIQNNKQQNQGGMKGDNYAGWLGTMSGG